MKLKKFIWKESVNEFGNKHFKTEYYFGFHAKVFDSGQSFVYNAYHGNSLLALGTAGSFEIAKNQAEIVIKNEIWEVFENEESI